VELAFSHDHSHFWGFRNNPRDGPLTRRICQTFMSTGTVATMPPSSMYHFWYSGPRARISSTKGASAKQKYKAKGVSLLDTTTGLDLLTVVVQEQRLLGVTPVSPVGQLGKLLDRALHEDLPIHSVEGVAEVDFQQRQLRLRVPSHHVPEGVCHYLNTPWTADAKVLVLEVICDLRRTTKTKTL